MSDDADNNQVQGNFIGTNLAGAAAVPNGQSGIEIAGSNGNQIGALTRQPMRMRPDPAT